MHKEVLRDKPIGKIANCGLVIDHSPRLSSPAQEAFSYLYSTSAADEVCLAAVGLLQRCLQKYVEGFADTKTAAAWPVAVSDRFWARLRAHEHVPVLVFAHCAIISRACEKVGGGWRAGQRKFCKLQAMHLDLLTKSLWAGTTVRLESGQKVWS